MYLKKFDIKNFRMISDLNLEFHEGVNILIGENNTGKTTILDALRLCFGLVSERRELYLTPDDFHIDGSGTRMNTIEFHLTFDGLTVKEQGVFIELLAIREGGAELQLHVRFTYDPIRDRVRREYWGGENEGQTIPSEVLELFYFVHLGL
jgi:putative ATP-dependent endonuclease of OLD family